jgi:hypothetical protein
VPSQTAGGGGVADGGDDGAGHAQLGQHARAVEQVGLPPDVPTPSGATGAPGLAVGSGDSLVHRMVQHGVPLPTAEAAVAGLPPGLSPYAIGVVVKHFTQHAAKRRHSDVQVRSPRALHARKDAVTLFSTLLHALRHAPLPST